MPRSANPSDRLGSLNSFGETLAYQIVMSGHLKCIKNGLTREQLIERTPLSDTILHLAACRGQIREVVHLMTPDMLTMSDSLWHGVIVGIVESGTLCDVQHLLNVDILAQQAKPKQAVIHFLGEKMLLHAVMNILNDSPGLLRLQDEDGNTVLHYAIKSGEFEMLRHLITPEAVSIQNNERWNIAHVAAENGILSVLVKMGLLTTKMISVKNSDGNNVAHLAAENSCLDQIAAMITLPMMEAKNKEKNTPMNIAMKKNPDTMRKILPTFPEDVQTEVLGFAFGT